MMRIVPPGSIAVRKWWLALIMVWLVASNVNLAITAYRARQLRIQAQGCREVLQLLEHPAVFREAVPPPKFVKGTRIYQDFEK
jgi:hypothetical protein